MWAKSAESGLVNLATGAWIGMAAANDGTYAVLMHMENNDNPARVIYKSENKALVERTLDDIWDAIVAGDRCIDLSIPEEPPKEGKKRRAKHDRG